MTTEWLLLLLAVFLILANAVFVAAEFALVTVDRPSVAQAAETGDRRARSLQRALKRLSTQLSGAQLGITVTSLIVGVIAEPSVAALIRPLLEATGVPESAERGIAFGIAFVIVTGSQMVFGELVPKNWAIAEPMRVGRAVAGLQRGFSTVARPLLAVLNGSANALMRAIGIEPQEELASARSARELSALVGRSALEGVLDQEVARRLTHTVELGDQNAADAMTARTQVHFLEADDSVAEVLSASRDTGHSRFLVVGESVDDIVGVVHFKYALAVEASMRQSRTIREIAVDVPAVPTSMPLDDSLEVLKSGLQIAQVVDEYGGTAGILTLEDLVEEIVGEIADEQDEPQEHHRLLGDDEVQLSGLLRPDEVEEICSIELPEGESSETLGGLVTELLGRFPDVADTVAIEVGRTDVLDQDGLPTHAHAELEVLELDGHRVDQLVLRLVEEPDEEDDEAHEADEDPESHANSETQQSYEAQSNSTSNDQEDSRG